MKPNKTNFGLSFWGAKNVEREGEEGKEEVKEGEEEEQKGLDYSMDL